MEFNTSTLEKELKNLTPTSLPESLLDRLDEAMNLAGGEVAHREEKIIVASSDSELSALEESLRELVPYGVPENMISRLDDAMARWHEEVPVEEKIVPIHPESDARKSHGIGIRSAAAVALLGAGAAFVTSGKEPSTIANDQRIPVLTSGQTTPAVFTPKDARSSVVSANDRGVIWTKGGQPVRCLEVHMNQKLQFENDRGEKLIVEQPVREVRFMKVQFD